MVNKNYSSKLDEVIKQTLSDYEAPSNTADWAQIERMLDAAPKSNSFRYKRKLSSLVDSVKTIPKSKSVKWIFSPYFIIGLVLVCGAYVLYTVLNSSKTPESTTISMPTDTAENTINADTLKIKTIPNKPQEILKAENEAQLPIDTIGNLAEDKNSVKSDESVKKDEKTENKKTENAKTDNKKDVKNQEQILKKQNPQALIDSRDSSTGDNEESKEIKNQSENQMGRNNFLLQNINADSIKKLKNQQSKDSLKDAN